MKRSGPGAWNRSARAYAEEGLDYDEELEQLTQDHIDKTRHTMQFVRRYHLMFDEP